MAIKLNTKTRIKPGASTWVDPSRGPALADHIADPRCALVCVRLEPSLAVLAMPDGSPFLDGRTEIRIALNWLMAVAP